MSSESLFEEKSLWDIFLSSVRKLPRTRFNSITFFVSVAAIVAFGISLWPYPSKLAEGARGLADVGIGFGSQILGFLVGGFAIFASVSKPEFFLFLYEKKHESGLSYLKYNLFSFVKVFVPYLALLSVGVAIKILAFPGGPASRVLAEVGKVSPDLVGVAYSLMSFTAFVICAVLLVWSLLALKSFIFNLYHIVMTVIRWEQMKRPA